MIKKVGFLSTLIIGAFLLAITLSLAGEATGGKEMAIKGRVIDPACYMAMNLKGEAHKQSAIACGKAGQAFGILDEKAGILYQVKEPLEQILISFSGVMKKI